MSPKTKAFLIEFGNEAHRQGVDLDMLMDAPEAIMNSLLNNLPEMSDVHKEIVRSNLRDIIKAVREADNGDGGGEPCRPTVKHRDKKVNKASKGQGAARGLVANHL